MPEKRGVRGLGGWHWGLGGSGAGGLGKGAGGWWGLRVDARG